MTAPWLLCGEDIAESVEHLLQAGVEAVEHVSGQVGEQLPAGSSGSPATPTQHRAAHG